jgi:hypothetical protein
MAEGGVVGGQAEKFWGMVVGRVRRRKEWGIKAMGLAGTGRLNGRLNGQTASTNGMAF